MTKDSEMTLSFIADAYGRCLGLFVLLLLAPALLTFVGGKLLRRRSMHYKPPWMCPAWASESDAYKLLFQEIYATQPIRLTRVVVGSGAIAMQSMVLLLVFWTLHGKMVFSRATDSGTSSTTVGEIEVSLRAMNSRLCSSAIARITCSAEA